MSKTIKDWLRYAISQLRACDIKSSRLDALILLCDSLEKDKSWVLAHPEYEIQGSELKDLNTKITQRAQHIPLAYLRRKVEFYGREFTVNEQVLVPRPESEALIEIVKKVIQNMNYEDLILADIGTGSGALAVTVKLEFPHARVYATDIDRSCLAVAKTNAATHSATLTLLQGTVLQPLLDSTPKIQPDIILANLPYVPTHYSVNRAATHEPALALYGGEDGLDLYRKLFAQTHALAKKPAYVVTESLAVQQADLEQIARDASYQLHDKDGLAQCFRRQA